MDVNWTVTGAVSAFFAVAAGAFAAHGLKKIIQPEALEVFQVGVRYHLAHALALVLVGALSPQLGRLDVTGWCFLTGTLLFSGSLYMLSLTGARFWGPVTPIGGVFFLAGWASLAFFAAKRGGGT